MAEIRVEPWYIFQYDECVGIDDRKWRIFLDDQVVGIVFDTGVISITKAMPQAVRNQVEQAVVDRFKAENPEASFELHTVPDLAAAAKDAKGAKKPKKEAK